MNLASFPVSASSSESALSPEAKVFVKWLFQQSGLDLACYREDTLARRLPACLRMLRVHSIAGARKVLEESRSLVESVIETLVIGVSSFFRDQQVFEYLSNQVLPLLTEPGKPLRIWSVGCSDGQEIYSVAMLLAEMGCLDRADLLGTDCRIEATRHAQRGAYCKRDVASVPQELLLRYFTASGDIWQVNPSLRAAVHWRTADATQITEPGAWDLILCRNLAMYLEPRRSSELWKNLSIALRPGGFLVVGKAERPGVDALSSVSPCVLRKIRG